MEERKCFTCCSYIVELAAAVLLRKNNIQKGLEIYMKDLEGPRLICSSTELGILLHGITGLITSWSQSFERGVYVFP